MVTRNKKLKKKIDVHISVRNNYSKIKKILASTIFEHRITTCSPGCNPGSSRLSWQIIPLCILAGPLSHPRRKYWMAQLVPVIPADQLQQLTWDISNLHSNSLLWFWQYHLYCGRNSRTGHTVLELGGKRT